MTLRPCRRAAVNRVRRPFFQSGVVMSPVQQHPRLPPGYQRRKVSLKILLVAVDVIHDPEWERW